VVEPFLGVYLVAVRGFPVARAGLVLGVYAAGTLLAQLVGGVLADRLGRRGTLTAGMLANGAALIALGCATGTIAIVVTAFAAGATVDLYRPAAKALVADMVPAADRARAYGLISWAANLGFTAAMLTGGMLAQAGFRWLFGADALTCTAFALLAWHALPETHARPAPAGNDAAGFGSVLRDPVMAAFLLVVLAHIIVYQQGFTTLPIAMHAIRLPPSSYGLVMAVNGLVVILVQPLAIRWLVGNDLRPLVGSSGARGPRSRRPYPEPRQGLGWRSRSMVDEQSTGAR